MAPYLDVFSRWSTAFDALMASPHAAGMSQQERCAARILEMQQLIFSTSLDFLSRRGRCGGDTQMLWDRYNDVFQKIIDLAESVLKTAALLDNSNGTSGGFTLDGGIVGPLYDISRRCRDPQIRRRAIRLLCAYPRQEGMWDGVLAARVAERVVEVEEQGAGRHGGSGGGSGGSGSPEVNGLRRSADVPDRARISDVNPIFDLDRRKAPLCYARRESAFSERRVACQEVIEWE